LVSDWSSDVCSSDLARADLDRIPMTARTAGARDDELSRNTTALPRRWLRPLDGGLPTGTAMTFKNKS